jgi:hypothetical protein
MSVLSGKESATKEELMIKSSLQRNKRGDDWSRRARWNTI